MLWQIYKLECLIYATTETLLPAKSNLTQCNLNNLGSFPEIYLKIMMQIKKKKRWKKPVAKKKLLFWWQCCYGTKTNEKTCSFLLYTHTHTHTHTHTLQIRCVRYITYIQTPHTHNLGPEGKLMKTLHKEPFDSFITKVPMTVLMEIFIIFWLLPKYHSIIKRGVWDVKVWKRKWECGEISDDWGATAFT